MFPDAAYAPDGRLWWDRTTKDGPHGAAGAVPRAASWLRFNVDVGDVFTTERLRHALGVDHEHFQRRLRELRDLGWRFDGMKDNPGLKAEYKLLEYGWWPGSGLPKPSVNGAVSTAVRREVFARDGSRCVVCGVGAGESYPNEPESAARMSVGHIVPRAQGGSNGARDPSMFVKLVW